MQWRVPFVVVAVVFQIVGCQPLKPSVADPNKRDLPRTGENQSTAPAGNNNSTPPIDPVNPSSPAVPSAEVPNIKVTVELATIDQKKQVPSVSYQQLKPLLDSQCVDCHQTEENLDLSTFPFRSATYNHDQKKIVTEILNRLVTSDEDLRMPLGGAPLSKADSDKFKLWLNSGLQEKTATAIGLDKTVKTVRLACVLANGSQSWETLRRDSTKGNYSIQLDKLKEYPTAIVVHVLSIDDEMLSTVTISNLKEKMLTQVNINIGINGGALVSVNQ